MIEVALQISTDHPDEEGNMSSQAVDSHSF